MKLGPSITGRSIISAIKWQFTLYTGLNIAKTYKLSKLAYKLHTHV